MASLQKKGNAWYCQFSYAGRRHTFTIGEVTATEARRWKGNAENLLLLIRHGRLEVPRGVAITDFILHDGKPPVDPAIAVRKDTTLHQLREGYLNTVSNGAIETNTLTTARIHLTHIEKSFGKSFILSGVTLGKLQEHITRRSKEVAAVTIKKELDTFRSVWNWGLRMKWIDQPFPSSGLVYPKTEEKLPFMTWAEIDRRVKAGGDADELWECLYLNIEKVTELLAFVKTKNAPDWVYPMIVMAAHTGARRSEMIRAKLEDIDLAAGVITIREKKRARGTRTTRRVPVTPLLSVVLKPLLKRQNGKSYLFGEGEQPLSVQATHKAFWRALKGSKWSVIKGWHTLRHSFISACASKGVDQRILDEWVGHQTEEQRVRYRHLYPSLQEAAIRQVFG
jgi:integrase